jgi:hypothetical protein
VISAFVHSALPVVSAVPVVTGVVAVAVLVTLSVTVDGVLVLAVSLPPQAARAKTGAKANAMASLRLVNIGGS